MGASGDDERASVCAYDEGRAFGSRASSFADGFAPSDEAVRTKHRYLVLPCRSSCPRERAVARPAPPGNEFFFYPNTPGELPAWPPKMQIGRDASPNKPPKAEDVPLFCDAAGLPWIDSDPLYPDVQEATSNHPDHLVNAIRHDLSLSRLTAKEWLGADL